MLKLSRTNGLNHPQLSVHRQAWPQLRAVGTVQSSLSEIADGSAQGWFIGRPSRRPTWTWNTQGHGLYIPGLLIWLTVLGEVAAVLVAVLYALIRLAMWAVTL